MVPMEFLALKHKHRDAGENREGHHFLEDLEFEEGERAAVFLEAYTVSRHHKAVFEESDSPGEKDHAEKGPVFRNAGALELKVSIPCEGHERVGDHKKDHRNNNRFHKRISIRSEAAYEAIKIRSYQYTKLSIYEAITI